ncbi:MAG: twin-arginine translocase TatA/TatE family subunit [Alphaproteobacteria bacterium]
MGNIGWWQILIVAVLVVLLFGRGKISELMGDVAKGITNFRKGLAEDEKDEAEGESETAGLLTRDAESVDVTPKKDEAAKG